MMFLVFIAHLLLSNANALGPLSSFGVGINGVPKCDPSVTTASGYVLHKGSFCSGDLIFEDTFDTYDLRKWQHENTLGGSSQPVMMTKPELISKQNWEFQWYTNNRSNSFCEEGVLHIRPTLTADVYGESFLTYGTVNIHGGSPADQCTHAAYSGCERTGTPTNILNPVRSARIRTVNSFAFKYGKVEVSAKMPTGDWLSPAIWFLPKDDVYGTWPSSGEIDLVKSRGNRELMQNGVNIGVEQISSTLHYGPFRGQNAWPNAHFNRNALPGNGWNNEFHRYQMEWTPEKITFSIDDIETGTIKAGKGFWSRGGFNTSLPGIENPWRLGTTMAPFDQEFYIIMNLAVGGTAFFPDDATNVSGMPWSSKSTSPPTEFWINRNAWLPTWNLQENYSRDASLLVDYIRVWAL